MNCKLKEPALVAPPAPSAPLPAVAHLTLVESRQSRIISYFYFFEKFNEIKVWTFYD